MLVTGGLVFTENGFAQADVRIEGDTIASVTASGECSPARDERVVDATGALVCPGLVDLHFHGCRGSDFCDATQEGIAAIAHYQASRGVTSICPATMTYPEKKLAAVMKAAARFKPGPHEAELVGINMEGPFISPNKVGAQNPAYVMGCDVDMLRRLQHHANGLVKLVDVAPEEPGAIEFIRKTSPDIVVSLAHTCADYDCALAAFDAGARQLTHLFNAMPGMGHRAPGPIVAALERDDVIAELIADGVHAHPAMVRLAFRLFGDGRIALISDSMRACGLGDGTFDLGGQNVSVTGRIAKLADGTIAGSVSDLASCVKTAVCVMGVDPWSAVLAASTVPARVLGIDDTRGRIARGCQADIVVFDSNMEVSLSIVRGKPMFQ